MDTLIATAAITGARHLRAARNGQDAAVFVSEGDVAVAVVSDGCSSGASSEVGARLGATLFARSLTARLQAGASVTSAATWSAARGDGVKSADTWSGARADVARVLAELLERMPSDREAAIHDHFLFTIVAAAVTRDGAAVWALGDGAYSFGDRTRVLGPFADNAPPYLAYDLLGDPQVAHFEVAPPGCTSIVIATDGALDIATDGALDIATDGALDIDGGLEQFATRELVERPDALRRKLALLARSHERIDWDERRVVRTPAVLQDDCAVGVLRWSRP